MVARGQVIDFIVSTWPLRVSYGQQNHCKLIQTTTKPLQIFGTQIFWLLLTLIAAKGTAMSTQELAKGTGSSEHTIRQLGTKLMKRELLKRKLVDGVIHWDLDCPQEFKKAFRASMEMPEVSPD